MTKRTIGLAAALAAKVITGIAAGALRPEERRDFFEEVERVCRRLIEAVQRRAGRDRINIKQSLN